MAEGPASVLSNLGSRIGVREVLPCDREEQDVVEVGDVAAHDSSFPGLGVAPVSRAAPLASTGPSSKTERKRPVWIAITSGVLTWVPAAMIAIESTPPGLVAR